MATFRFAVSGQYLDLLTPTRGIADGLNVNSFTFDFRSTEWADCTDKWLHLYNPDYNGDDSTYDLVIIEDEIPAERGINLPSGIWEVFVHGNVVLNGEVIQRYVTETQSIQIVPSGIFDDSPIGEVAPSVAEQLSAMVREAYNARITTATATVDDEFGTPAVVVSTTGDDSYKTINFDFHNLRGNGIASVVFIQSGDNAGRITVTLTDGTVTSFDGIADALAYLYDHTTEVVVTEIQAYLEEHSGDLVPDDSITYAKLASDLTDTDTLPQMDGTAAKGSEPAYARADHVHPSDTSKVDVEVGKGLSANDFTDTLKTKLDGIASGAEVNQNAFGNAKVGSTTIAAGGKTDTIEFIAGDSIQITPDSTNKTITITSTASGNVTGVKGDAEEDYRTGNVNMTKGNIGLGNVDNTSDMNKPVSTATQLALDNKTSAMIVDVTDSQPTDPDNKLWIPQTNATTYSVPVMADMTAGNIAYSSGETYNSGTAGKELQTLNTAITNGTLFDGMPQIGKKIPANSNLNDYTTAGTYWVQSDGDAATIANMPRTASGTLYVINRARGGYKTQTYYPTTSVNLCYSRNYNDGSWTDWDYRALISEVERDISSVTTNVFDRCAKEDTTSSNVSFSWRNDGIVILNGTSTAEGYNTVYSSHQSFPCGMEAGGTYRAAMYTTNPHCYLTVFASVNNAYQQLVKLNSYSFSTFMIPSNATGAMIRVTVESGYSFSNVYARPVIYSEKATTSWNLMGYGSEIIGSGSNLNNISTPGTYLISSDAVAQTISNIPRGASGTLYVINRGDSSSYQMQIYIPSTSYQIIYTRFKSSNSWGSWSVRGEMFVVTGTQTTSVNGTAAFSSSQYEWLSSQYMCLSVVAAGENSSGMVLLPYKYGDADGGRWGFRASLSSDLSAIANRAISFIAILYRYN